MARRSQRLKAMLDRIRDTVGLGFTPATSGTRRRPAIASALRRQTEPGTFPTRPRPDYYPQLHPALASSLLAKALAKAILAYRVRLQPAGAYAQSARPREQCREMSSSPTVRAASFESPLPCNSRLTTASHWPRRTPRSASSSRRFVHLGPDTSRPTIASPEHAATPTGVRCAGSRWRPMDAPSTKGASRVNDAGVPCAPCC